MGLGLIAAATGAATFGEEARARTLKRWDPSDHPIAASLWHFSQELGWGRVGEIPAVPVVKLGAASILLYLLVENKLGKLLEWKVGKVGSWGHFFLPLPQQSIKGFLVLKPNRLLTCAWPGLCKQQTHSLQGPGPLQSSKAPSDEEWPATDQDRAQPEED